MEFYDFMKKELNIAQDGGHKECRAKDPDNCRKCHTGPFGSVPVPAAAENSDQSFFLQ